jgi:uroporphyrin-3 C-methyltransferase
MNAEASSSQEPPALPEAPAARSEPPPAAAAVAPSPTLPRVALAIALLALAVAGWQWWETRGRADTLHSELAQRLAEGDGVAKESRIVARQAQEAVSALQAKVGVLEARLGDSQSQQVALEAMYQELTRNRDDRVLAEVEQTVNLAVQQLQLAGNVEAALIALQSADARLARTEQAQFIPLRRALIQDIERLKALPLVDVPGLSIKLDGVVSAVDRMPLAFEGKPRSEAAAAPPAAEQGFWSRLAADLWRELSQLIRIERLDRPDPAVLSPQNAFILRENLKLRLINARLALLQRDSRTYREDLKQAQAWIERYFDVRSQPAQDATDQLRQLSGAELKLELPTLDDTLTALRNFKLGRDKTAAGR